MIDLLPVIEALDDGIVHLRIHMVFIEVEDREFERMLVHPVRKHYEVSSTSI
jgi:hypothetical protein